MEIFSTVCPRNCYSTCSLKVSVEDGKVAGIDPHPDNLATPEGPCLKGLAYEERAILPIVSGIPCCEVREEILNA